MPAPFMQYEFGQSESALHLPAGHCCAAASEKRTVHPIRAMRIVCRGIIFKVKRRSESARARMVVHQHLRELSQADPTMTDAGPTTTTSSWRFSARHGRHRAQTLLMILDDRKQLQPWPRPCSTALRTCSLSQVQIQCGRNEWRKERWKMGFQ